jgi:hypothetical protein
MSALGHSRPSHFVPVLNNVRYASDSDHSRYESELTLWAKSGHCRLFLLDELVYHWLRRGVAATGHPSN